MLARTSPWILALLLASCGASTRAVYQSDVRFERCHAAELDPAVTLQAKYDCWEGWLDRYAEGQPPHRILYARERMVALAYGEPLEGLPADATPPEASVAEAPAAEVSGAVAGDEGSSAPRGDAPRRPRYRGDPTCDPVCGPPWQRCIARCTEGRVACVEACESEYRACMRGCF
jgi:hypothetical protein